jgi:hypothetical protein
VSFRVVFSPAADRDLVDLWLESEHQREMTSAVDAIRFEVDPELRQVNIYQLWTFGKRGA